MPILSQSMFDIRAPTLRSFSPLLSFQPICPANPFEMGNGEGIPEEVQGNLRHFYGAEACLTISGIYKELMKVV